MEDDRVPKNNRNCPRNREAKGPSWVPPPKSNRAPNSTRASARDKRRWSHQEMIRLKPNFKRSSPCEIRAQGARIVVDPKRPLRIKTKSR
jgi:hypothetical protein